MKKIPARRYKTGEYLTLVELFLLDARAEKFPLTINDLISTKKERKIISNQVNFSLIRARVTNEKRYDKNNYGYRAQFYLGEIPINYFCNNRFRSCRISSLYDDTYTWVVDERTIHLFDINYILNFTKNVTVFSELGERICSGLAEGMI